jgi:hypothetical protein
MKSPVRENCTPGSVRGARGNPRPYLDLSTASRFQATECPNSRGRLSSLRVHGAFQPGANRPGNWKVAQTGRLESLPNAEMRVAGKSDPEITAELYELST